MFFLVWGQDAYPGELALEGPIGHGVSGQIFAAAFRGRRVAVKTLLNEVRTARALQSEWTAPLVPVLVDPGPCHSRFQATCLWALADSNLFSIRSEPASFAGFGRRDPLRCGERSYSLPQLGHRIVISNLLRTS